MTGLGRNGKTLRLVASGGLLLACIGLRGWVQRMHAAVDAAIVRHSVELDYDAQQTRAAHEGHSVLQYTVTTTYRSPSLAGDTVAVTAIYFPSRDRVFYKRLRVGPAGRGHYPIANDSEPALGTWDAAIRQYVGGCTFPVVDLNAMPERAYLDSFGRGDVERLTSQCDAARQQIAGLQRTGRYYITWLTDAPGPGAVGRTGSMSLIVQPDGRPEFVDVDYN